MVKPLGNPHGEVNDPIGVRADIINVVSAAWTRRTSPFWLMMSMALRIVFRLTLYFFINSYSVGNFTLTDGD